MVPLKYIVLFLSIALLPGCAAVKFSPSMDKELSKEAHRYLSDRMLSVDGGDEDRLKFFDWYTYKYIDNPAGKIIILEASKQNSFDGWQCFEPMLFIITLGLVPAHCVEKHELVFKVVENGESNTITKKAKKVTMQGWIPLFLLFSRKWEYDLSSDPYERIFISAINEQAGGL